MACSSSLEFEMLIVYLKGRVATSRHLQALSLRTEYPRRAKNLATFGSCSLAQAQESPSGFRQGLFALGEVHPDQVSDRLLKETGTRHRSNTDLLGHPDTEGDIVLEIELGDVHEDVVCPLRPGIAKPRLVQAGQETIPPSSVIGPQLFIIIGGKLVFSLMRRLTNPCSL